LAFKRLPVSQQFGPSSEHEVGASTIFGHLLARRALFQRLIFSDILREIFDKKNHLESMKSFRE
jgi:hypothetical protein